MVVCESDSQNGNTKNMEIKFEGEKYYGGDVDVMPKKLFRVALP